MPVPNQLPARTTRGALIAAEKRGHRTLDLRLLDGKTLTFVVEEVLDDAILGTELGDTQPALVPYHAIAKIRFLS